MLTVCDALLSCFFLSKPLSDLLQSLSGHAKPTEFASAAYELAVLTGKSYATCYLEAADDSVDLRSLPWRGLGKLRMFHSAVCGQLRMHVLGVAITAIAIVQAPMQMTWSRLRLLGRLFRCLCCQGQGPLAWFSTIGLRTCCAGIAFAGRATAQRRRLSPSCGIG